MDKYWPFVKLSDLYVLLRRLEVIKRFDRRDDIRRIPDIRDDLLHRFISKRRFVEGAAVHGGGEYALHSLFVLRQRDALLCLGTAHEASSAVRGGEVPVLVTLANANKTAVAHVHRD